MLHWLNCTLEYLSSKLKFRFPSGFNDWELHEANDLLVRIKN